MYPIGPTNQPDTVIPAYAKIHAFDDCLVASPVRAGIGNNQQLRHPTPAQEKR